MHLQRVWRDNEDEDAHAHGDEDQHEYLDVHQLADRRPLAAKDVTSRERMEDEDQDEGGSPTFRRSLFEGHRTRRNR